MKLGELLNAIETLLRAKGTQVASSDVCISMSVREGDLQLHYLPDIEPPRFVIDIPAQFAASFEMPTVPNAPTSNTLQ